jgi:alkanesulfonate monooxygenase SsuD/methylene tetrahydromethanopterin reductase-like flavin-dependent oxidoreductase (luciferase family)
MRVGICIPIGERGPERRALPFAQMRELAQLTDSSGLDSIWVADHLFFRSATDEVRGTWESVSILGALADATSRVELGPLVLCGPFRNAGMMAWAANTLDEISGGRFVLGLGAGWSEDEFRAFDFEFDHKVSLFADQLEVIVPLLREGRVEYDGRWAKGAAELRPPGPRPKGPPIMIACSQPRMMSLTARWADRWNSVWYGLPTDEFRAERALLVSACETAGRDPAEIEVTAGIAVADPATTRQNGPESVAGTEEAIAEALNTWRAEGVAEVMCRLEPPSLGVVETIARAVERLGTRA